MFRYGLRLVRDRWRVGFMGTTVIGGMVAASVIGIFFVPAIFFTVEKWSAPARRLLPFPEQAAGGGD